MTGSTLHILRLLIPHIMIQCDLSSLSIHISLHLTALAYSLHKFKASVSVPEPRALRDGRGRDRDRERDRERDRNEYDGGSEQDGYIPRGTLMGPKVSPLTEHQCCLVRF
jgi:hypothetical protein